MCSGLADEPELTEEDEKKVAAAAAVEEEEPAAADKKSKQKSSQKNQKKEVDNSEGPVRLMEIQCKGGQMKVTLKNQNETTAKRTKERKKKQVNFCFSNTGLYEVL